MNKILQALISFMVFTACKNNSNVTSHAGDTSTAKLDYPYTIENPDTWEKGDPLNSLMVLKAYKAYETGNIDEAVKNFADSVHYASDIFDEKLSKDSIASIMKSIAGKNTRMTITMYDWESVISRKTNEQFVSVWYKQIFELKDGDKDSAYLMDDLEIKNGKITSIDQKRRKYPITKK